METMAKISFEDYEIIEQLVQNESNQRKKGIINDLFRDDNKLNEYQFQKRMEDPSCAWIFEIQKI